MGLWWKDIDVALPEDEHRRVSFEGDPEAMPKHWFPILWRYHQSWHLLQVISRRPFWMHFQSADGSCMQCRKLIRREFVAVRIGPKPVTFWATSEAIGQPLKIVDVGLMIPGLLRKDNRDIRHREDVDHFRSKVEFI